AEFRADEDAGAPLVCLRPCRAFGAPCHLLRFLKVSLGCDIVAGPGHQRGELDGVALLALMDACTLQVFEYHLGKVGGRRREFRTLAPPLSRIDRLDKLFLIAWNDAVGRQALDGEGPGDADAGI